MTESKYIFEKFKGRYITFLNTCTPLGRNKGGFFIDIDSCFL